MRECRRKKIERKRILYACKYGALWKLMKEYVIIGVLLLLNITHALERINNGRCNWKNHRSIIRIGAKQL